MCVWIEDADGIRMNEKALDIVYQNNHIRDFLNSRRILGVSGIKGQGKTFLLKVKRSRAEKSDSIECFPRDFMVDQLDSALVINPSLKNYLKDYTKWVAIWKIAISATIISSELVSKTDQDKFISSMPDLVKDLFRIKNLNYRPSVFFNHLTSMNKKDLKTVLDCTSDFLELLYSIHQAVYVFIDKTDQAFSIDINRIYGDSKSSRGPRNASFWQYSQYALSNAAYDIYSNSNQHIKVYHSIRQEALIDTHLIVPNLKRNIESYIVNLDYSKYDLEKMFNMYVNNEDDSNLNLSEYKESNPIKAFLGVDTIENLHVRKSRVKTKTETENAFDYIYRHSLKRPSDIMKICKAIYLDSDNNKIDICKVRRIVNDCAGDILNMYISELSPFLPYDIISLFDHINTNILSFEYIKYICNRFANQIDDDVDFSCTRDCINCNIVHPFSVLYNIGLLGVISHDIANNEYIQKFNRIGGSVFLENITPFPKSDFYFIHPCLMDVIRRIRNTRSLKHYTCECCVIGDNYPFSTKSDYKIIQDTIFSSYVQLKKENVFISSTINDLKQERQTIKRVLSNRGHAAIMSEESNFPLDSNILNSIHSHDYCLEKISECGNFISIIGKVYGGNYSGELYKDLADEIIEKSEGRIKTPSISLMEYFLAIKKGIPHYAFISVEFDDIMTRDEKWDEKVIVEYNFLTHQKNKERINDNWISRYKDLDDLENRIKNIRLV